jgi:uncharacterized protein YhdP
MRCLDYELDRAVLSDVAPGCGRLFRNVSLGYLIRHLRFPH